MTAFTFGSILGGIIGIPIVCLLAVNHFRKKEEKENGGENASF